jgi:hypothetical protein
MNMNRIVGVGLLAASLSCACGGSPSSSEGAMTYEVSPSTEEAALDDLERLPTQEELDAQMEQRIDASNADAEFEKLQKAIEEDDGGS